MATVPANFRNAITRALPTDVASQNYLVDDMGTVLAVGTAGTAEASKALVLDSSKGIATITTATITTLTATTVNATTVDATTLEIGNVAVGATAAEINAAADVSVRRIAVADANYAILVANSGKPHMVANVTADRTFTFPAEADGLDYTFLPDLNAADDFDWIFNTESDTNYFTGGVVFMDSDAADTGDEISLVVPDGNSNSKFQINLPQPGTVLRFICNGTTWNVSGQVMSTTAPAFADQ